MDIASLQKILIFRGLNPKEIADALTVLSALERTYQKKRLNFSCRYVDSESGTGT